jgi:hypothetical protein
VIDQAPKTEEDIKEERRRQRWNWFWTPFITLASVVSSIAMLMMLIQTCQQRNLPIPLVPPTSPLHQPGPDRAPGSGNDPRAGSENEPAKRSPAK